MKRLIKLTIIFAVCINTAFAQTSREDKKAQKLNEIRQKIASQRYTFIADYAYPQRGGSRSLTSDYDFRVRRDSVISYLPYFGQAYFDVPYNPTDGGIKFTSTKFDYKVKERKHGGWHIEIVPRDVKNLNKVYLDVSEDGYANLSVNSNNRDPINFNGYLKM